MKYIITWLLVGSLYSSILFAKQDHQRFIQYAVDDVMTSVFSDFAGQVKLLQATAAVSCVKDNAVDRKRLRLAWQQAYLSWMKVEPFSFGPVTAKNRDFNIYFWPVKKSKVLPVMDNPMTVETLKEYSIAGKGLAGLEYVLYDTSLNPDDEQLCRYLLPVTGRLALDADALLSEWHGDSGYAAMMKSPGRDNPHFIATQDVINQLFGKLIQHSGGIVKTRLGLPVGLTAEKAKPYKVEARRSGLSLSALSAVLETYRALLEDKAWAGFSDEQKQELSRLRQMQRASIQHAIELINQTELPLFELVQQDNDAARKIYQAFRDIDTNWRAIARVLNVSAGFNDNDGD